MRYRIKAALAASCAALSFTATAQDSKDRTVEQYECRDVMRDSGPDRDVAIAFLHGFLLGKSGSSQFNVGKLKQETDAFIERCLNNPTEKAVDAMIVSKGAAR